MEQEFIQRLQNGEGNAFEQLVDAFQKRVYNTCLGFVFSQDDAADLCQEVFVEVHRSIHAFEGRSSLATWIHRIAVTKSLELLRSRKRKKRAAQLMSLVGLKAMGYEPTGHAIDHPGIQLENKELGIRLEAAISKLSDNQRTAFTLCKIDGKSYEEVAEIMELSLSSIESLLFRARKALKSDLENYYNSHY